MQIKVSGRRQGGYQGQGLKTIMGLHGIVLTNKKFVPTKFVSNYQNRYEEGRDVIVR